MDKQKKIFFGVFIFFLFFYILFLSAPTDFPAPAVFRIEEGMSLRSASLALKEQNFIRSRVAFEAFVILYGGEKHIQYADYYFESKLPVWQVARRISKGDHNMAPVVVTIPEGFDRVQIADTFALKLANFNKTTFLKATAQLEGHLFPDTYFFSTTAGELNVQKSMTENFDKKIASLRPEIISSGKVTRRTEKEVIIMASIIEREARGEIKGKNDRGFISGILWRRLAIGMPLQVDAAPETYKTKGLPKAPIANPGMRALEAALYPQASPYLYYLHDKQGNIYYAKTFAEHRQNIEKYLQ